MFRARKVSVFYNKLGHVDEESDDGQEAADVTERTDYSDLQPKTDDEEADYPSDESVDHFDGEELVSEGRGGVPFLSL